MALNELINIIELGLVYSLVAMGIFLSFRIMNISDLTVDASFSLGAAIFVSAMSASLNLPLSLLLSAVGGSCAGLATATLAFGLGLGDLLGSILVMYALYSVNFRIVGSSNLVLTQAGFTNASKTFVLLGIVSFILLLVLKSLHSERGLALRVVGINPQLLTQYGFSLNAFKFSGLMLSNALIALGGALFSFVAGFYDINIGAGTLISGLASLVMGECLSKRIGFVLVFCVIGSLFYRFAIHMGFNTGTMGLLATDLNLITASVIVIFVLSRRLKTKGVLYRVAV